MESYDQLIGVPLYSDSIFVRSIPSDEIEGPSDDEAIDQLLKLDVAAELTSRTVRFMASPSPAAQRVVG